jgi:hypothetical protein
MGNPATAAASTNCSVAGQCGRTLPDDYDQMQQQYKVIMSQQHVLRARSPLMMKHVGGTA